ncbi:hypothetical protein DQM68_07490 [Leptospira mayottensis]|uniref:Uncharacterized protein n=1 Tax=Leptospira mayottensis TaxID=1137606 RepID=A0ABN5NSC3_9LEPT|nr:hypothetical protein DQM68_07490 [Leptospira mayottensis]AXR64360.1 hypothetical protein DQM28_09175 [Leptospira mayottensis]AXR69772.1 hypothetical protein DPV73_08665 [Leptospira mayottensis]AZQ03017.1 hypothetical protein LEP1GSC190_14195 [Leptospira mayottensis 200901116]TGN17025.1 hypothetical protein EHR03_02870 [Leptospira mayottensis]
MTKNRKKFHSCQTTEFQRTQIMENSDSQHCTEYNQSSLLHVTHHFYEEENYHSNGFPKSDTEYPPKLRLLKSNS